METIKYIVIGLLIAISFALLMYKIPVFIDFLMALEMKWLVTANIILWGVVIGVFLKPTKS